jgi:ATP-binding cassette subfamily C protein CydC
MRVAGPAAPRIGLATALGAGAVAADIGLIASAAWLISRASQHPNEAALAMAIVVVQFCGLSRGLLRYGERLVGHDAALHLLADLRVGIYRRLERLAPAGLLAFRRGDLLTRMVADVDSLQDVALRVIPSFGIAAVVGALAVVAMGWLLPAAGAILAGALVCGATIVPWLSGHLSRRRESGFAAARAALVTETMDLIDGAAELVAFGAVGAHQQTLRERDSELTAICTASAGTSGIGAALTTLLSGLAGWGCLLAGIGAVRSGQLDGTDLAVITLTAIAAFEAVTGLPAASQALHRARLTAARVFGVLDAPLPVHDPAAGLPLPCQPPEVVARAVQARYPGASAPALRGIDLALKPGHRTAIVGPSGAGKSTLAAVMLRFLDHEGGSIALNGTPIDELAGDDIRTIVGIVGQDTHLFDTTVRANLAIGRADASDDDMRCVLARVGLAGWLDSLPDGLGSEVGADGARLSGGQRQRLSVARALLADFPVLVLDEPTEHLDPAAAEALTSDLLGLTSRRCTLLITHQLDALQSVDEIVVVEGGQVLERGTHEELLDHGGRYAQQWQGESRTLLTSDGSRP